MPGAWTRLHRLLGPEAPPPLILAAWPTPALWKILRVQEQIDYAAAHGLLDEVEAFLRGLREDEWYHLPGSRSAPELDR